MDKVSTLSIAVIALVFAALLSFKAFENQPDLITSFQFEKFNANIIIEEDPNLKTLGTHQRVGGVHFIKLKKYPICLLHEIRHATEGEWHKGRDSDEDCYQH